MGRCTEQSQYMYLRNMRNSRSVDRRVYTEMAMSETKEEAVASISSTFKTFIRSPGIPEHTGQPFKGVKQESDRIWTIR